MDFETVLSSVRKRLWLCAGALGDSGEESRHQRVDVQTDGHRSVSEDSVLRQRSVPIHKDHQTCERVCVRVRSLFGVCSYLKFTDNEV